MTFFRGSLNSPSPARTILTGNTATTVLAAANHTQSIAKVRIVNVDSGAVTATLDVYDGSTAYVLVKTVSIAAGSAFELTDEIINFGESLRVTSGNASGLLHVHVLHSLQTAGGA